MSGRGYEHHDRDRSYGSSRRHEDRDSRSYEKERYHDDRDYRSRGYSDRRDAPRDSRRRDRHDDDRESSSRRPQDTPSRPPPPSPPRSPSPPAPEAPAASPPKKKQRTEPVSLEDLMAKKQAEEKAKQKPVFLTTKQREERALAKRQAEVEALRQRREAERQARRQFLMEAQETRSPSPPPRRNDRWRRRDERRDERRDRSPRTDRRRAPPASDRPEGAATQVHSAEAKALIGRDQGEAQQELEEIRKQYLGIKTPRSRVIKPSEKYQRVLDWDLTDDTSQDFNELYSHRRFYKPGFGSGNLAGIDPQEQLTAYRKQLNGRQKEVFDKTRTEDVERTHGVRRTHWSEKRLEDMEERDWRIFKEDFNISIRGRDIPAPIRYWRESALPEALLNAIETVGYKEPTPIQRQAIPIALAGRDILGIAETGSGKTAAFLLPMLVYLSKLPPMDDVRKADGPYALIMAPVRELVQQIEDECKKFAQFTNIRTVSIVGGQSIEAQGMALVQGCEVVIATPGRMIDCLRKRYAVLNQCNYVVLDEADKMINMGFVDQVNEILNSMPSALMKSEDDRIAAQQEAQTDRLYRTTIMYSATMPTEMETLARTFLRRPAYIAIGEVGKAVDRIKQRVLFVKGEADKKNKLLQVIQEGPEPPIIVFANQKKVCDTVAKHLNQSGYSATVLHSSKTQDAREYSLEAFKSGKFDILVATDVAGRGLDISGVTHVINFDLPKVAEHYVHRIGRTGRAGMEGLATSFMTHDDTALMWFLKNTLTKAGQPVPSELAKHPAAMINPELADKVAARMANE